jgi:hypothetical protein
MALDFISSQLPEIDGCTLFTAVRAILADQGVPALVEHQIRDRAGRPVDLSELFPSGDSQDSVDAATGAVKVRVKEAVSDSPDPTVNPLWELPATVQDAREGLIRFRLPKATVEYAGVYLVSIGVLDADAVPRLVDSAIMSVERSLWATQVEVNLRQPGPPSLLEIRTLLVDRDPADNSLIDRVEFSTDQVLEAIVQPIQYFNEQPPPINKFTTRNFPYPAAWQDAIIGNLLVMAAHNFRRNQLPYSAGGVSVDDKNKEGPYLAYGNQLLQAFKDWTLNKKVELNVRGFMGNIASPFGRGSNWGG